MLFLPFVFIFGMVLAVQIIKANANCCSLLQSEIGDSRGTRLFDAVVSFIKCKTLFLPDYKYTRVKFQYISIKRQGDG
ncbi:hypothetical protein F4819DRAFT_457609 [Hypoxylon fuscum]|nr:hypothetical protein F4819DRAFT_457609 [Hypoxylon fuscum]